jgi:hypothetical protein
MAEAMAEEMAEAIAEAMVEAMVEAISTIEKPLCTICTIWSQQKWSQQWRWVSLLIP